MTEAGWSDIYGNYLVVSHSENFQTKYAHCSRLIAQQGDVLRQGERIALVGSTGVSTGPHLHFECIVEELRCDPLWLLPLPLPAAWQTPESKERNVTEHEGLQIRR